MVDRSVGPPSCRDLKERALQGDVASSIDARRARRKHIPGVTEVWHAIYSNDSAAIERIADIQVTHPAPVWDGMARGGLGGTSIGKRQPNHLVALRRRCVADQQQGRR